MESHNQEDNSFAQQPGIKKDDIEELKKRISFLENQIRSKDKQLRIWNEIGEEGALFHHEETIEEVNHALSKITGYSASELKSKKLSELFEADSFGNIKHSIQKKSDKSIEAQIITKSGKAIDIHVKARVIRFGHSRKQLLLIQDIRELKRALRNLEDSEKRHRMISSLLSDYVYTCTIKPNEPPNLGWISGAIEHISGYTQDDLEELENGWFSVIHPEDVQKVADTINYKYIEGDFYSNEYRIIDKSGKIRWMIDRSRRIHYDTKSKELTLLGATKDVTEQKETEECLKQKNEEITSLNRKLSQLNEDLSGTLKQLSESEANYRNLIENASIGVGISKNERILYANKSLMDIYKIDSFEEFSSKKVTEYMPEDSKKLIKERISKYKKKIPQDNVFRHEIIRSDGKIRTLQIITAEITFNGEQCRQALVTDISSQLETEIALQRAASIFKNIQIGILIYRLDDLNDDCSLRLISCNPASSKLIGIDGEKYIGKKLDEIFPNLRQNQIPQQYAEVARNKIPIEFDDMYYEDGQISPGFFSVKVFPLPDQCVGVSFENISERRKAEKELLTRNHELNNFVYKVSHDLRAPLSSIKGLINLAKLEKDYAGYLQKIEGRADHLDSFIRDILSHSRNLNSAVIIEKLNINSILQECINELKYLPGYLNISKVIKIKGDDFYSDRIRLTEICRNMVSNAIKYQDTKKSENRLKVDVLVTPKKATLQFEDNGIGITQEFLKDIFKMFFRATEEAEGSGIGLYIVQQAIEKLQGKIDIESKLGIGSTFTISIPNMVGYKQQDSV